MKTKKSKIWTPVGAIVIRLIKMKSKTKKFYSTILLFVVLLWKICFIVRFMFFCAIFDRQIRMKTKQIRKQRGIFRLTCMKRWTFYKGRPNLNEGTLTTDGGTRPSYNLSTGYISI